MTAKNKHAALMARPDTRVAMRREAEHQVRGRSVSARDADDLVQSTLVRMLEKSAANEALPESDAAVIAYVRRAVRNAAMDAYRAERRLREQVTHESGVRFAPGFYATECPDARLEARRSLEAMRVVLAVSYPRGLPLFEAALLDEDAADTCSRLGISRANYDQIWRRIRVKLTEAGVGR